jgi:hypothetical protein
MKYPAGRGAPKKMWEARFFRRRAVLIPTEGRNNE